MKHVQAQPVAPSSRTELPIPEPLDRLVLECLAKRPDERPATANELSRRLAGIETANPWTEARAREWWATYIPGQA